MAAPIAACSNPISKRDSAARRTRSASTPLGVVHQGAGHLHDSAVFGHLRDRTGAGMDPALF